MREGVRNAGSEAGQLAHAYLCVPVGELRAYGAAQVDHWTKESFSANFRRLLTLEQDRSPELAQLYRNDFAAGPLTHRTAIFRKLTDPDEAAAQLAKAILPFPVQTQKK